jgi:hypothetical protein
MVIHCKYDSLVKCGSLKPHPKNRNKHPEDQLNRLAKILKYQGLRAPIVVSTRSGKIVKGHGTLQAIQKNGWDEAPVVFQDFEDDDQEWLFLQSDNAIASWAELDLSGINADLTELGPFDIDLVGVSHFTVDPTESMRESGQTQNGPTAEEKLAKYLDRDFFEIKLTYDNSEYETVIEGFKRYMQVNSCGDVSEVVLQLLKQWKP